MTSGPAPSVNWLTDLTPTAWVAERLTRFDHDVGSVVPEAFEAYARILHPRAAGPGQGRWTDLARQNGRVAHPGMQFPFIAFTRAQGLPARLGDHPGPSPGRLPTTERRILVEILTSATATPERCYFAVWEGWGNDDQGVAARLELPQRRYLVHAGPIAAALAALPRRWRVGHDLLVNASAGDEPSDADTGEKSGHRLTDEGPNLWWPEDRSWFVATEVDVSSTYVGGTSALMARLLQDPRLEVVPAQPSDSLRLDSDPQNV